MSMFKTQTICAAAVVLVAQVGSASAASYSLRQCKMILELGPTAVRASTFAACQSAVGNARVNTRVNTRTGGNVVTVTKVDPNRPFPPNDDTRRPGIVTDNGVTVSVGIGGGSDPLIGLTTGDTSTGTVLGVSTGGGLDVSVGRLDKNSDPLIDVSTKDTSTGTVLGVSTGGGLDVAVGRVEKDKDPLIEITTKDNTTASVLGVSTGGGLGVSVGGNSLGGLGLK